MQIKVDEDNKKRPGDISALSSLSHHLKKTSHMANEHTQKVLGLWIDFIEKIFDETMAAHYQEIIMKLDFDFPFEEEFAKRYPRQQENNEN